jgi:threonine/homoserine/homoserine lactone efflux protein
MANLSIKNGFLGSIPFIFGVFLGNLIFVIIAVFGISEIIFKNLTFSTIFYVLSGAYLLYFSFDLLIGSIPIKPIDIKRSKVFFQGLFVELSNPKSVFFTASLVGMIITPESTMSLKLFVIFWLSVVSLIYEIFIIWLFSIFRSKINKYLKILNKVFCVILFIFGAKLIMMGASNFVV